MSALSPDVVIDMISFDDADAKQTVEAFAANRADPLHLEHCGQRSALPLVPGAGTL
jgi:hypothetical protein